MPHGKPRDDFIKIWHYCLVTHGWIVANIFKFVNNRSLDIIWLLLD
jgi:hypothetical protein